MKIDLVYDADCPNVVAARTNLLAALARAGSPARWSEWDRASPDCPPGFRDLGSPSILIGDRDVSDVPFATNCDCCRIYRAEDGTLSGAPTVDQIVAAMARCGTTESGGSDALRRHSGTLAALPAVGFGLLPKLACPACWPAYSGLMGSVGLAFLTETAYLLPLTAAFLALALATLAVRARRGAGYGPLALGLMAAAAILGGKFAFESDAVMYAGVALLIAASFWNAFPGRVSRHVGRWAATGDAGAAFERQRIARKERP